MHCLWWMTVRLRLTCDGTCAETRFCLSTKRMSPLKSAGASVQSTTGSRSVRISGSNAGYTIFRGSVKSTGYPLHSPVSPSLPLPCITMCHHISTGLYQSSWQEITLYSYTSSSFGSCGWTLCHKTCLMASSFHLWLMLFYVWLFVCTCMRYVQKVLNCRCSFPSKLCDGHITRYGLVDSLDHVAFRYVLTCFVVG